MKRKSLMTKVLAAALAASMVFTGCAKNAEPTATDATATEEAATEGATTEDAAEGTATEVSHDEELVIEMYDVAANFQGEQTGWYGKVLKDKFNIKLNIIA
ncbi:MAG: sugar ABC transporter substrate-binding protein, partial [Fibrobacter sp.]|nr:sugar ABC transporter substrate-binding protein [Fibrobacter sp.]